MNIADKILHLRKKLGLSQEQLAEQLGVSRQSVSKWESGTSLPDVDKVVAMSSLFGVSTDYLLTSSEEKNISQQEDTVEIPKIDSGEISKNGGEKKMKNVLAKKIVAAVSAAAVIATAIGVPIHFGGIKETWWEICGGKVQYPYVLVHGLGGYGEDRGINEYSEYWGSSTGDLSAYLEEEGYQVYEPSVGPVSSTWDRTCELYAQLTGTTVDYGEAHSKEHNHARYGRTYTTPLFEGWGSKENGGQIIKINLVGHSFGGATVRMLTSLLEYGSEAEKEVGGEISPLFEGGKGDWVHSVTTLCAPHNGSSLTEVINTIGGITGVEDTTELLVKMCFAVADLAEPVSGIYDFQLEQFGIGEVSGGMSEIVNAISSVTDSGKDHAGYDLSPDGAAEVNKSIKLVDDVYYFSYSYSTTREGKLLSGQVPDSGTYALLYPTALAIGSYTGTTDGGIVIDESWQENDGLVSVVSATSPTGDEAVDFEGEFENLDTGIWHVMPTKEGHHGTVIGLTAEADETHKFYTDLFTEIDNLKRK